MNHKLDLIKKLVKINGNIVFVGGTSEYLQGIKSYIRDIDVAVLNFDNLHLLGWNFEVSPRKGKMGATDRRVIYKQNATIDIFKVDTLPEYKEIDLDGIKVKVNTVDNMLDYLKDYPNKQKFVKTIERLKNFKSNKEGG